MASHKPDGKLVETPVDRLCGNPDDRKPSLASDEEIYGLKGPEGLSANGGIEFALVYKDVAPNEPMDRPSDTKLFRGNSSTFKGRGGE